jgi:hypothetical protein
VSQVRLFPRHELFEDRRKNLAAALAKNVLSMEHHSDFVPFLDPFEGVTILAEAFGCRVYTPENGDPVVRAPLVRAPEDVYDLRKPNSGHPVLLRVLETLKYWERTTGGLIPIGTTDPQGPLDVASLIWESTDFITSCITHKKEVHYLLEMITDVFVEFYSRQRDLMKNFARPVHSFPLVSTEDGIAVSDDQVVLMSPELYREFGVPYLQRIADAFGGLYYHSCGDYGGFIDDILGIRGLRAVNGHLSPLEFKPEYISRATSRGIGVFVGISDRDVGWEQPNWSEKEAVSLYHDYYLPAVLSASRGRGVVLVGYGGYAGYIHTPGADQGDLVDSRGHLVRDNPFVNLQIAEKNENYRRILDSISRILRQSDLHDRLKNAEYQRFAGF